VHVDWALSIVEEITQELGERLRGVAIYAEQDRASLEASLRVGRIRPLAHAGDLEPEQLARCRRVVAMMGVEPLQEALSADPQFIIAGRCSDAALYAALPLMAGFPAGLAWHAGKIVECGTLACETLGPGVMVATLREDSFSIRPVGPGLRCTTQSVAAHSLYETADPFLFAEASGTLDISDSAYEQEDDRAVRVVGSRFVKADAYSVKLEGAELIGHEAMLIGGVRDPLILGQLDSWLERIGEHIAGSISRLMGVELDDDRYRVGFQVYGRSAVMGELEPSTALGHEVGIVCTTLAPTQDEATEMARLCRQPLLHAPIPQWKGSITGFACLHNPAWVELGPAYRFCLNHVLLPAEGDTVHRLRPIELGTSIDRVSGFREVA
jgi:Acyclic terpene utilisation family protein AtuA